MASKQHVYVLFFIFLLLTSHELIEHMIAIYKPFSSITEASLKHALAETSSSLSENAIESLMQAYDSLDVFPEVPAALKSLASSPNVEPYIFSNGTDAMVSSSVNLSPSLVPYAKVFKGLITVQEIEIFKPDPRVYQHLAKKVGKENEIGGVWLVSGNPFDVVGARAVGMQAAWVDRAGKGWVDGLGELVGKECRPTIVVKGVADAVSGIEELVKEKGKSS